MSFLSTSLEREANRKAKPYFREPYTHTPPCQALFLGFLFRWKLRAESWICPASQDTVIRQGENGQEFYVIRQGEASVYARQPKG